MLIYNTKGGIEKNKRDPMILPFSTGGEQTDD